MEDTILKLADMTWNEAHNHLMSMKLPTDLRHNLEYKAAQLRTKRNAARRRAKLTHAYHSEMWYRLLAPLKYELSNARVGLKLKDIEAAPERYTAFKEYVTLLEKLLAGLKKMQMDEACKASAASFEAYADGTASEDDYALTPAELAKKRDLPNKGAHWTDWISDKTRARIETLFDAIPTKAKRPKPFERRVPPQQHARDVEALQRRTLRDIGMLDQELNMLKKVEYCTKPQLDRLVELTEKRKRMVFVLFYITTGHDREPMPLTWHGLAHKYYDPEDTEKGYEPREWVVDHLNQHFGLVDPPAKKKKTNRPRRYRT